MFLCKLRLSFSPRLPSCVQLSWSQRSPDWLGCFLVDAPLLQMIISFTKRRVYELSAWKKIIIFKKKGIQVSETLTKMSRNG